MKTIIARFTELKENVSEADSEFDDLDYNDVDTALKSVGISIKDASGQFRDLDDVFLELAEKWDTLDRNTQRYIATTAAGSRQQSRFIAMMSDYDRTLDLQAKAYESAGQSTVQFNKYQDTVQYKIKQIKNTWEQLRVSILDQDIYKNALDIGNKLLSSIKKDFNVKDLASIAIIGLTIGKKFITQFVTGLKTNIGDMTSTFQKSIIPQMKTVGKASGQELVNNIQKSFKESRLGTLLQKTKIGDKLFSNTDRQQLQQNLQQATATFNQQIETINTQFMNLTNREKELFSLNGQPITGQALTDFSIKLQQVGNISNLTEAEVQELYTKMGGTGTITAGTAAYEQFIMKLQQMSAALSTDISEESTASATLKQYVQAVREGVSASQQLQSTTTNLGNSFATLHPQIAAAGAALKSALGSSIGTAITSGIITGISTGDWTTALKTGLMTLVTGALSQLIPQIISWLGKQLITLIPTLLSPAIVGTAIILAGLVGAAIFTYYKLNDPWESLSNRLDEDIKEMKENLEDLKETAETAASTATADKQAVSTMEDIKEEWDELNNKISLTEDEQTRYNELIETINQDYADTVSYYDEMNNRLVISESLWNKQLEEAKEIAEQSQLIATNAQSEVNAQEYDLEIAKIQKAQETEYNVNYLKTNTSDKGNTSYEITVSNELSDSDYATLNAILASGESNYESLIQTLNEAASANAIEQSSVDALEQVLSVFHDNVEETDLNWSNMLQEIINSTGSVAEYYHDFLEQESTYDVDAESQRVQEQYVTSERQNFQNNVSATVGTTEARMVTNLDEVLQALFDKANGDITEYNQTGLSTLTEGKWDNLTNFYDTLVGSASYTGALEELNISEEELEEITGITKDNYDTMLSDTVSLAKTIKEKSFNQGITDALQTAAEEIPDQLVDSFTEISANISTMSLDEYQQNLDELKNQYKDNVENIDSAAVSDYEQYANMFLTQNESGQITGGFFSNLFTSEDAATAFTDAIKNGDFEAAGDALRDQGQGMWADLFTKIDPATISTMSNFIANNITSDEAQEKAKSKLQSMLSDIMSDDDNALTENEFDLILNANVDWENVNPINIEKTMNDLAEQLVTDSNGALSLDEALKKVQLVFGDLNDLAGSFTYGSATAFNTLITAAKESGEAMVTQGDTITSILDEIDSSIGLTREQLSQLDEAGLSDIYELDIDTGKFEIKMDKITTLFSDTISTNQEALQTEINTQQKNLNTLIAQREQYNQLLNDEKLTDEDIAQINQDIKDIDAEIAEAQEKIDTDRESAQQEIVLEYQEYISVLQDLKETIQEAQDAVDEAEKTLKEKQDAYDEAKEAADNAAAVREKAIADAYEEEAKTIKEAEEAAENALESLEKAYDTLADAQEKLAEAQEDLYEAIHGSADWDSGLERLDSANQMLTGLNTRLKTLKSNMEDASDLDSMVSSTEAYIAAQKEKMNLLEAEKQSTQQSLDNMLSDLYSNDAYANVRDSVQFTVDGRMMLDTSALESADASDAIKDALVKLQSEYNKEVDSIATAVEEMESLEDEWESYYTDALKNYITTQDKVVEIIKENAQAEIDAVQDKYDNLKEADNDYISALQDAIQKQRNLRDQESQYEELATKEKKLALMSRDTSGANQKDVATLEDEVETSRQSLLDKEVDNLISSMQEMYETQQKAREEEIEYLNALMETTDWWIQANEIIQGWTDSADAVEWFMSNDSSVQDMSTEAQIQYSQTAEDYYTNAISLEAVQQVLADVGGSITDAIQADVDGVNQILSTLNISTEVGNQVLEAGVVARDEAIKTAQTAVETAQESVTEAEKNLVEMQTAYQEALDDVTTKTQEAAETRAKAVQDAYDTESTTLAALTTAEQELSTAQNDLDTATKNLDIALQGLGDDASAVMSGIDDQIRQLQNNCVQYLQDLANEQMSSKVGDLSPIYKITDESGNEIYAQPGTTFGSISSARDYLNSLGYNSDKDAINITDIKSQKTYKYASGGMVDYTGPAWVDGTKSEPEAFLDPEDTSNIAALAQALRSFDISTPLVNQTESPLSTISSTLNNVTNNSSTSYTGGTVSINLNIESISSDYDVESMLDLMEERINEASNQVGSSVILRK